MREITADTVGVTLLLAALGVWLVADWVAEKRRKKK